MRSNQMSISSLLQQTSLSEASKSALPKLLVDSSSDLEEIRRLAKTDSLMLFTPAVAGDVPGMDPFEPLGRSLSEFNPRVRHMPYLPNVGVTETHVQFVEQARGAVVVVCTAGSAETTTGSAGRQVHFARAIYEAANIHGVPIVLVLIMEDGPSSWQSLHRDLQCFGAVIHCDKYSASSLREVARRIYIADA